ncbi:hypothetical protein N9043_01115 [bacterium]|nr:hypothetical protein [bacterium]
MTDNYRRDWFRMSGHYTKQPFRNTEYERSPHSAIEAIDHFSKKRAIIRYPNPEGHFNDGFAKKGESEEIPFWCFIRTVWAGKKEEAYDVIDAGGIRTEGVMALYYNPYHQEHPKEGIHLHLTNHRSPETEDYSGFADLILYKNILWKVTEHNTYDQSYDDGNEYMGKATIERYKPNIVNDIDTDNSSPARPKYTIR